jgi:hypothetical protein
VPNDAKIPAVGCSLVHLRSKVSFCKLHSTAQLCTALKARARFDSLHPLQLIKDLQKFCDTIAISFARWWRLFSRTRSRFWRIHGRADSFFLRPRPGVCRNGLYLGLVKRPSSSNWAISSINSSLAYWHSHSRIDSRRVFVTRTEKIREALL